MISPLLLPTYNRRPLVVYLYICPECGWWTMSNGLPETFGSLVQRPGPEVTRCLECGATLALVAPSDRLVVRTQEQGGRP